MKGRPLYTLSLVLASVCLGLYLGRLVNTWSLQTAVVHVQWQRYSHGEREPFEEARGHLPTRLSLEKQQRNSEQPRSGSVINVSPRLVNLLHSLQLTCHSGSEGLLPKKYERFLQYLDEYATFHRDSVTSDETPTLVWLCDAYQHCGGLADRMKGITYSLLVAMFTRRRLQLSWGGSLYGEQTYLKPNAIDWTVPSEQFGEVGYYSEDYFAFDPNLETGLHFLHLFSVLGGIGIDVSVEDLEHSLRLIAESNSSSNKVIILSTNLEPNALMNRTKNLGQQWIIDGLKQYGLYQLSFQDLDDLVGIVFRYLFQFTDELIAELSSARGVLGISEHQKYTGVHLRTGFAGSPSQETVDHPKLIRTKQEWERVLNCAVKTADSLLGQTSVLFLATDSSLVKHLAIAEHGSRFRTLDNTLIHLDRMEKYPHEPFQNETEGTLSTWIDFLLLAESYAQVRTDSGFPFAAGQLCSLPPTRTYNGLWCLPEVQFYH